MNVKIGQIVNGEISGIVPYGIFVKIAPDTQGLVHISEVSDSFVANLSQNFKLGMLTKAKVIDIDPFSGQISLSMRALNPNSSKNRSYKRYWTNHHFHTGFSPLKAGLTKMESDALKRFKSNK